MLAPIFSLLAYIAADFGVSQWLKTHFIGVDPQEIKCLPWTAFLYSKNHSMMTSIMVIWWYFAPRAGTDIQGWLIVDQVCGWVAG